MTFHENMPDMSGSFKTFQEFMGKQWVFSRDEDKEITAATFHLSMAHDELTAFLAPTIYAGRG